MEFIPNRVRLYKEQDISHWQQKAEISNSKLIRRYIRFLQRKPWKSTDTEESMST